MKILFLTPQLPYPPNAGGTIKSYKLTSYLASHYELTIGTLLKNNDINETKNFLSSIQSCELISNLVDIPRTGLNFLRSIFKNVPLNIYRNYNEEFYKKIAKIINSFDVVIVDHYVMYQYIPQSFKKKKILHQHNAEFIMWNRYAELEQNLVKKMLLKFEAFRIKRYENKICINSDIILAAPNDIDILTKLGVSEKKFYLTYHLNNDDYSQFPNLNFEKAENALMYVGTLSWEANIDGLVWFIENHWNLLKKEIPDLIFYIIGKNPDIKIINAIKDKEGIECTGFVDDLEEYFVKAKVFIAPLRFGSGMKVKVISAMSRGIPTVTTTVGIEGISAEHRKHFMLSNTDDEIVNNIIELIKDKDLWSDISFESRKLIQEKYTWDFVYKELDKAILDEI